MTDANLRLLQKLDEELSDPGFDPELALAIFEHSPDAIVITDSKGIIRRFNKQAELLFGYTRQEICGKVVDTLLPAGQRSIHKDHHASYWSDPRTRPMGKTGQILFALQKEGTEFEVEINLSPITTRHGRFVIATVRKAR